MNIANLIFHNNLRDLKYNGSKKIARAKYNDGTQAYKYSIDQVFEIYRKGELPIHTYRETAIKSAIQEILWIYKDQSNRLEDAHKRGIKWWDDFNVGDNTIGNAYGAVIDEYELMYQLLDQMALNPFSNRHILSLWNEPNNEQQIVKNHGLLPCAFMTQYTIHQVGEIRNVNMHLQIRSSDYIMAGAINRIQYYALGLMICGHLTKKTGIVHELNNFSVFTMDMHIYDRHLFALDELLDTNPTIEPYKLELKSIKDFYEYDIEDFRITKPQGIHKLSKSLDLAV